MDARSRNSGVGGGHLGFIPPQMPSAAHGWGTRGTRLPSCVLSHAGQSPAPLWQPRLTRRVRPTRNPQISSLPIRIHAFGHAAGLVNHACGLAGLGGISCSFVIKTAVRFSDLTGSTTPAYIYPPLRVSAPMPLAWQAWREKGCFPSDPTRPAGAPATDPVY